MHSAISVRLSVMMFLQFFIWGAWFSTPGLYLGTIGFEPTDMGWIYSVGPIACIISPFLVGMIADRFFSTERVLGVMHLLAAGALLATTALMTSGAKPPAIIAMLFVHTLFYFPTLALVNSLAMHTMTNSEKQFPLIRVFGTIGWIVAGIVISFAGWKASVAMFYVAAAAEVLMGLYSFSLPHMPPPGAGKLISVREVLGLDALSLLKQPSYFTFMLSSFLICIPLAFYYAFTGTFLENAGIQDPPFKMTFGQMSEIFFMLIMPLFFSRLGVKWMLAVGMLAWVVRYALFALGAPAGVTWMIIGGIVLHGICYDFFFVTGQIYTDKAAPAAIRGQAQGMLVLFTLGLGMFIGAQVAGRTVAHFATPEAKALKTQAAELLAQAEKLQPGSTLAGTAVAPTAEVKELMDKAAALNKQAAAIPPLWQTIWTVPAVAAAMVLVLFVLIFRDTTKPNVTEGEVAAALAREELA
ncbi:MAG: MFS transporter [Planctomycetes bacterium]|nr:MFS transporter [Planctomycetota bacterium]